MSEPIVTRNVSDLKANPHRKQLNLKRAHTWFLSTPIVTQCVIQTKGSISYRLFSSESIEMLIEDQAFSPPPPPFFASTPSPTQI
jgi:hypothetical protein